MTVPVITSLDRRTGPTAGGAMVTITGTALASATGVSFGATPAAAGSFGSLSATTAVALSPAHIAGTVDVTLTTAGGTSATGAADLFVYGDGLFTVAEAREFNGGTLNKGEYTDAAILAKEAEIREVFVRVCGVDFSPTLHTDEYHDTDGSCSIMLDWPKVISVSAASQRSSTTWTALTSDELDQLHISDSGLLTWEYGYWYAGRRTVKVSYTAGHSAVPELIKRAALIVCTSELPGTNVPFSVDSYSDGGVALTFGRGDGFNENWYRYPDVVKALRLFNMRTGIA